MDSKNKLPTLPYKGIGYPDGFVAADGWVITPDKELSFIIKADERKLLKLIQNAWDEWDGFALDVTVRFSFIPRYKERTGPTSLRPRDFLFSNNVIKVISQGNYDLTSKSYESSQDDFG